jgi:hypothetical protein
MGKSEHKKLCKLAKKDYLKENLEAYKTLVVNPRFICKKCGRVSNADNRLCKEKPL